MITKEQLDALQAHNEALQIEIENTSQTAITAMKAASEVGLLMQLVEWLNTTHCLEDVSECLFRVCKRLGVNAYCLIKKNQARYYFPTEAVPETAKTLLEQACTSDFRILSRKRIVVFKLDYLVLIISNAPWEDEASYGRLNDILLQAAALAEARSRTITVNELIIEQHTQVQNIMSLIKTVSSETQMYARGIMKNLSSELSEAAMSLDLTEAQEQHLHKLSDEALDSIEVLYSGSDALEGHFLSLIDSITRVKELTESHFVEKPPKINDDVTLF